MQKKSSMPGDKNNPLTAAEMSLRVLESAKDFVIACDTDLRTIYINPGAYEMTGYSVEEMGLNLSPELVHNEQDAAWSRAAMKTALEKGFAQGESVLITKDGRTIDVQQKFFAIRSEQGEVLGVGLVMRDISELHGAQRDLLTKSAIIDSSDDFIAATDRDLACIYANPGAYTMSGYQQEEIGLDLNIGQLQDTATAKKVQEACRQVLENGITWQGETELLRKDGKKLTTLQKLFPLSDENDHVTGLGTIIRDISDIKAAEQAASNMLDVLKNILNSLDANVYVSDMENDDILFVNRAMRESFMLGETFQGKKCWQVMQRGFSDRCSFCPIYQLEKDPETPVTWEIQNPVTGRYYKNVDSIIDWEDGKKAHLQYAIDITDVRTAQHEADKMLGTLKNILNGMDAYVYVSDMVTDEIFFINSKMRDGFGLGEDAVGKTCWKVLQDGFTERCSFCPNKKLAVDPTTPVVWEEHNTVTGRYYKNVDSIIEWTDGKMVHMQHSTDITDIVAAQRETHETRERLGVALESSQAGVWELDIREKTLTYDELSACLFGLNPTTRRITTGMFWLYLQQVVVDLPAVSSLADLLQKDPVTGNPSRDFHLCLPDGTHRWVRCYGKTIRDDDGHGVQMVGMCIDITPQVTMETDLTTAKEAAENASLAKSQFLSNMSHEIRTPMNAITGMADLLMGEKLSDRQRRYVRDIKVSSSSLLDIINDILDFSKIEAGKLQLVPVDYDIMELLQNLNSMFAFAAVSKRIHFEMEICDELPACLYGDDIRLRQALVNILGNAIKFTEAGEVRLVVSICDAMLCFAISDTGVGIRAEDIPLIFNDFDQLDSQNNRHIGGTGLGLAITKNLIDMMEGSITVESEYGKGTTFRMQVPLVEGDTSKLAPDAGEFVFVSAPDAAVLVVDDNEVNLHVASGMLGLCDIQSDTALSGQEAIEKIWNKKYDIVFMDHMMPGMDGVETTLLLRKKYTPEELPIVALTANAVGGARETLLAAGMNDYLSKPMDKVPLNRVLQRWLPAEKLRVVPAQDAALLPKPPDSPLLEQLAKVPGLNTEQGLKHSGEMAEVYEKAIRILARRLPDIVGHLEAFLAEGDIKSFGIEVHGLKGSLANLGAEELARMAAALEAHAKEYDVDFCLSYMPELAARLAGLEAQLNQILNPAGQVTTYEALGEADTLRAQVPILRNLLNAFEGDDALEILKNLARYDYGEEWNARLQKLCRMTEEFDYDGALSLLAEN